MAAAFDIDRGIEAANADVVAGTADIEYAAAVYRCRAELVIAAIKGRRAVDRRHAKLIVVPVDRQRTTVHRQASELVVVAGGRHRATIDGQTA